MRHGSQLLEAVKLNGQSVDWSGENPRRGRDAMFYLRGCASHDEVEVCMVDFSLAALLVLVGASGLDAATPELESVFASLPQVWRDDSGQAFDLSTLPKAAGRVDHGLRFLSSRVPDDDAAVASTPKEF